MTSEILCAHPPRVAGFPTHLQTREGYEILESLQEEIQAGAGQEGDTCSPIAGKARMQPPGSLAATLPGEDHLCRIKSWILRQVMVQGVGLPSPSTPQPSPLTLLWQGELQFSLSPVSPADEPGRLDTTHINILTFACTHTHTHTRQHSLLSMSAVGTEQDSGPSYVDANQEKARG